MGIQVHMDRRTLLNSPMYSNVQEESICAELVACDLSQGDADHITQAVCTTSQAWPTCCFSRVRSGVRGTASSDIRWHAAKICDANYSGQTLQRVFINWAEQHPTEWKQDQSMGALWAVMAAWPGTSNREGRPLTSLRVLTSTGPEREPERRRPGYRIRYTATPVERVTGEDPIGSKLPDQIVRIEVTTVSASAAARVECHPVGAEVTERPNCGDHAKIAGHLLIGCSSSEIM